MNKVLIVSMLLLLMTGNALAGIAYDKCLKEEKTLKSKENHDCGGLSYLLNPNACFATRKTLKEYAAGKCKKIGLAENVDFSVQQAIPESKASNSTSVARVKKITTTDNAVSNTTGPETPQQEITVERLQTENARLKAENNRLKAENEQLKKISR